MEKEATFITKEDDERNNIVGGIAVDRLRSLIERIERLEEEKKGIQGDIRDIFAEAKAVGFDVKVMLAFLFFYAILTNAKRDKKLIFVNTRL